MDEKKKLAQQHLDEGLLIIESVAEVLANTQATLKIHEARIKALQYLRERISKLHSLELAQIRSEEEVVPYVTK